MTDTWTPRLTHPDKPLYPAGPLTKQDVAEYFERVAPVMLPHLADRPATFKRCPDGVEAACFIVKNAPRGTPEQVRTVALASPESTKGREKVEYVIVDDLPTLLWTANLGCLEIHVPQWKVGPRGARRRPDLLVFDLDPGASAGLLECARVACLIREELADDGLRAWPKVSGGKGIHLYVPVERASAARTEGYVRRLAARLVDAAPNLVVDTMARSERTGKVFIDWNQNNPGKTTIAAYSLRARTRPTVAAPVTWDEIERCQDPEDLVFGPADILPRLDKTGAPFADLGAAAQWLPRR